MNFEFSTACVCSFRTSWTGKNKTKTKSKQGNISKRWANYILNGGIYHWKSLKHFNRPIAMIMVTVTTQKCTAIKTKRLVPLWGILIPGMRPCGWHGPTKVAIPFHSSTIFHSTPFVFHLEKQNCSPFSAYENMASQKALREVSITGKGV